MQGDPDLQMVARIAYTFNQDPVRLLNDLTPVQLAAFMAAHNVVANEQRAANEQANRAIEQAARGR